jgi:hypothetical protein
MQKLNIILGIPDDQIVIPEAPYDQWDENTTYKDYLKLALDHSLITMFLNSRPR